MGRGGGDTVGWLWNRGSTRWMEEVMESESEGGIRPGGH